MLPGRKERSDISTARSAWRRPFRGSSICVATAHGPNIALSECQTAHEPRLRASATRLDRASASGADPAESETPENPVVIEEVEGPNRSQRVTKRLAEPETAGSTAGRDRVASYLPFGLAGMLPAGEARNRNREAHAHPPFDDAAVATSSAGVQTQLGDPFRIRSPPVCTSSGTSARAWRRYCESCCAAN